MKSLKVRDGDFVLATNHRVEFAYGKDKLLQDLKLWLLEPLGIGYTSRSFGSTLESLVGENSPEQHRIQVVSEIQRVLGLYLRCPYFCFDSLILSICHLW